MTEITDCTSGFYTQLCGVNVTINPQSDIVPEGDCKLIIGQMGVDGTATPFTVERVLDRTRTDLFGEGSMLNAQIDEGDDIAPSAPTYAYVLPNDFGAPGTGDIAISGIAASAASGTVIVWVNGQAYSAPYDPNVDTDATVAAALAAVINSGNGVSATAAAEVITVTTDYVGEIGGWLDIRTAYSCRPDLTNPSDVTLTVSVTPGTGVPDLSGLAAVHQCCSFVDNPYTDDASIAAVADYVCSTWTGSDCCSARAYGVFYGDFAAAEIWGPLRNNGLISYQAINGALTPPYLESSAFTAIAFNALNNLSEGISESITGEVMPGMLKPEVQDLFSDQEKAFLIDAGMGYFDVTAGGDVIIGRATSTYRRKNNGALDNSFISINAAAICAYIKRDIKQFFTETFVNGNFALRQDGVVGTRCRTNVLTEAGIRNALINRAQRWSSCNLIQNIDSLIDTLDIRLPEQTGGCIDVTMDPEKVEQVCCFNFNLRTR